MSTGALMLSQEFTDSTNKDQFLLATLLDARLIQWHSPQTMQEQSLTGATLTSTGKLMPLDQLARETFQTLPKETPFQLALPWDAIPKAKPSHQTTQ